MKPQFKLNQRVLIEGGGSDGKMHIIKATITEIQQGQDLVGNPEEYLLIEFNDPKDNKLISEIRIPARAAKPYRTDKLSLI